MENTILPSNDQMKSVFNNLPKHETDHEYCERCREHMLDCECDDE